MGNVFGKDVPLKDILRENKRTIKRAIRELDREKLYLEREEKRLVIEIKKNAKAGQMKTVKIMAKDLVRTRQSVTKFVEMRSHLEGVSLKLQTIKSHQAMGDAMNATAKAMVKMNKAVNIQSITKMMTEFEKENAKSEMMQEMMGDAIDDALEEDGNEEEEDLIVNQVLDEIGVNFDGEIPDAPVVGLNGLGESTSSPAKEKIPTAEGGVDPAVSELEARLNNLKRD